MHIVVIGGGPGGLYFALLAKKRDPNARVVVLERNRADDTFGFGVVFSDATLEQLGTVDPPSLEAILAEFYHWDEIDIHIHGEIVRSTGHGYAGLSRHTLLRLLQERATEVGVEIEYEREVSTLADVEECDLVVIADGVNSQLRTVLADQFEPDVDLRPNRFVWLGTDFPFEAFTFYFKQVPEGLLQVHAYRYEEGRSTFIVECSEETFQKLGLDEQDEDATVARMQQAFTEELKGHRLLKNRSIWRQFPTVTNRSWRARRDVHGKDQAVVLLGDAAHTAHFSIGSGTKLALEDAIALTDALFDDDKGDDVSARLERYESDRRPAVESLQRAAQVSLEWFENTERVLDHDPLVFSFSLLTRSLRVTHENLKVRDPAFIARVDQHFAEQAELQSGITHHSIPGATPAAPPPPMFNPLKLRDMVLANRIAVSPMCMYSAEDGTVDDFHLVHLGSRAMGGAGLIIAEMTDVSRDGRITPGCAGMYEPEHIGAWKRITSFVHRHTSSRIALQLGHAGRKGSTKEMWRGIDRPLESGGWDVLAPSALPYFEDSPVPKPMDASDMEAVRKDFVRAAEMALEADFDMLEVHMAHGYLLATFLSPLTNHREDEFGGRIENRARFPMSVFNAVRSVWPQDRPMSVRVSATDWHEGGIPLEDVVALSTMLKDAGCDIIDVSTGLTVADQKPRYGRLFQVPYSEHVRSAVGIPTMAVGNISSYSDANSVLAARRADLCVLARAHLFDPYWTRHAAHEQDFPLPWPAQYPLRGYRPHLK